MEHKELPDTSKSSISVFQSLNVKKLLSESFLIIISILLALFINEWRTNYNLEKEKEKILASIVLELEENLKSLNYVRPYHKKVSKSMMAFLASDSIEHKIEGKAAVEALYQFLPDGIREPRVQSTAWTTAQLSEAIRLFDNETIYQIAKTYEHQSEGVEEGWKMIIRSSMDLEFYKEASTKAFLLRMAHSFKNLSDIEGYLMRKTEETLKVLKGESVDEPVEGE